MQQGDITIVVQLALAGRLVARVAVVVQILGVRRTTSLPTRSNASSRISFIRGNSPAWNRFAASNVTLRNGEPISSRSRRAFSPNPQRCSPRARRPGPRAPAGRCRSPHARKRPCRARTPAKRCQGGAATCYRDCAFRCIYEFLKFPTGDRPGPWPGAAAGRPGAPAASGWLMLKVPCTDAIGISRSAAARRIRLGNFWRDVLGHGGQAGAVQTHLHTVESAGLDGIQPGLHRSDGETFPAECRSGSAEAAAGRVRRGWGIAAARALPPARFASQVRPLPGWRQVLRASETHVASVICLIHSWEQRSKALQGLHPDQRVWILLSWCASRNDTTWERPDHRNEERPGALCAAPGRSIGAVPEASAGFRCSTAPSRLRFHSGRVAIAGL